MNPGIHLGELEQVLPVIAGCGVVIRGMGQPEVGFSYARMGQRA